MSQYSGTDMSAKWSALSPGPGLVKTDLTSPFVSPNGSNVAPQWQSLGLPTWGYHHQQVPPPPPPQHNPSLPPVSSIHSQPPSHQQHYLGGGGGYRTQPPVGIDPSTSQSAFCPPLRPPPPPSASAQLPFPSNSSSFAQSQMLRAMQIQQQARQNAQLNQQHHQMNHHAERPASVEQMHMHNQQHRYMTTSNGILLSPNHRYPTQTTQPAPVGSLLHPNANKPTQEMDTGAESSGILRIETAINHDTARLLNPVISDISPPGKISSSTSNFDTQPCNSITDSTRTAAAALLGMAEGDGGQFQPTRVTSTHHPQNEWNNHHLSATLSPRPELNRSAPNSDTTTTDNYSEDPNSPMPQTSPKETNNGSISGAAEDKVGADSSWMATSVIQTKEESVHNSTDIPEGNTQERRTSVVFTSQGNSPDISVNKDGREATPARDNIKIEQGIHGELDIGGLQNGNDNTATSTNNNENNIEPISDDEVDSVPAASKLVMALSDVHEPISPAATPQRCASVAADSSTPLIDVVSSSNGDHSSGTPQPTEINLRAAQRLEEKIHMESIRATPTPTGPNYQPKMPYRPTPTLASPPLPTVRQDEYTSSPALARPQPSPVKPGPGGVYTCEICNYTNESKFHFNSHMNTHADHLCGVCDYRARTEGRLKKHMKDFHSEEQRVAAGIGTPEEEMRARQRHAAAAIRLQSPPSMVLPPASCKSEVQSSASNSPSALERMQIAFSKPEPMLSPSHAAMDMSSPDIQKPANSQSSKPKTYRCKQCPLVLYTKEDNWNHQRTHIKPEKLLTCPKCQFVTEYKHHLEYHLRNHFNSKPFKCNKCQYTCVNKSMLNSHMKSHSNFYQYRCADCTYATKYCHSLKLHLRKYGHSAIGGEGSSGSPQETDEFGRRRDSMSDNDMDRPPTMAPYSPAYMQQQPLGQPPNNLMEMILHQKRQQAAAMASNIATFGAQLPTISNLQQAVTVSQMNAAAAASGNQHQQSMALNNLAAAAMAMEQQQQQHQQAQSSLKCRLCNFQSYSHKELVHHQLANHQIDLAKFYGGIPPINAPNLSESTQNNSTTPAPENHIASGGESIEEASPAPMHRDSPSDGAEGSSGSPVSAEKCSGDEGSAGSHSSEHATGSSRRKGKAIKLDQISLRLQGRASPIVHASNDDDMDTKVAGSQANSETRQSGSEGAFLARASSGNSGNSGSGSANDHMRNLLTNMGQNIFPATSSAPNSFIGECPHCGIAYKDTVMFTIHMGYHGYDNPFRCNRCGEECHDRLRFFMHIAQAPH